MTEKEQAVIDILFGETQKPWSYCDTSCSTCKFYHEECDMGATVSICVYGLGKSKDSCHYYMTGNEYFEIAKSVFVNLEAENAKLRDKLEDKLMLFELFMRGGPWVAHSEYMKLMTENAKLRELVRALVYAIDPSDRATIICNAAELMAEPGVEVDS